MRFGSLFTGGGGLDLGLEAAGLECAFQVELDTYATKVLERHWPNVPRWGDIREVNTDELPAIELLAGGFPCQPHSRSGHRKASADERDLWGEFVRIIRGTGPRWVLAENVDDLLSSEGGAFFGRVLRDLAALGFDAEWESLPAGAFGAPHLRRRVFLVAHARGSAAGLASPRDRGPGRILSELPQHPLVRGEDRARGAERVGTRALLDHWATLVGRPEPEPFLRGVGDGVAGRVDRNRLTGNGVVPVIPEWIGRRILAAELPEQQSARAEGETP